VNENSDMMDEVPYHLHFAVFVMLIHYCDVECLILCYMRFAKCICNTFVLFLCLLFCNTLLLVDKVLLRITFCGICHVECLVINVWCYVSYLKQLYRVDVYLVTSLYV